MNDKWDEKEPEKGHKLVDAVQRCVVVPDDSSAPKYPQDCTGKYEYMPDGSWKGAGTCTDTFKGGDKISETWEEGSHLKEYTYKNTSGTGKYEGARGGGGHFELIIVSPLFEGKSAQARHRMVHAALGDMLEREIHALSIKAYTPDEI